MKPNKTLGQWIGMFLVGFALIVVYKMFDSLAEIGGIIGRLFSILTPFVIGFVIAFLLYMPAKKLETLMLRPKAKFWQKTARPLSIAIVYVLAFGLLALVGYLAVPALGNALIDFVENVPSYYTTVTAFLEEHSDSGLLAYFDVKEKLREVYDQLKGFLTVERVLTYVKSVVSITASLVDVVMAIVISLYMLFGREYLFRAARLVGGIVFKNKTVNVMSDYLHKIAKIFQNYVYSQLIDALVVSILATIGFLIARMPNAPALGIMLGLLNIIPYFGAIIGGLLCVLFALLSGNFYGAVFIAIYIVVMQQIDANIIQPRIVGQTVGIKPIYVLLGITVCGGLFGFWGILIGAPVMAVVQLLLTDYIASREKNKQKVQTWNIPE